MIYGWANSANLIPEASMEFHARYEYQCTSPHKYANGRKCEGGRTHKLSSVRKVSVADKYPGGIIAWIDYLIDNDPALIEEMLIELPPIIRSEYQIARWKRQVLPREVAIKRWAAQADACEDANIREHHLDATLTVGFELGMAYANLLNNKETKSEPERA